MAKDKNKPIESLEAEQSVIGAILNRPDEIFKTIERIRAEDFYHLKNQIIFQTMIGLAESGTKIELNTVITQLSEEGEIDKAGGRPYLIDLLDQTGHATDIPFHVEIIRDKSTMRRIRDAAAKIYHASSNGVGASELLYQAIDTFKHISEGGVNRRFTGTQKRVKDWILVSAGEFWVQDIYKDLGINDPNEKKAVLMALSRFEKEQIIEKLPGKRGHYRTIEKEADKIDFLHADPNNWIDVKFPMGIDKYVKLYPTNIIVCAGEKGSGKTAFCLDTARLNMGLMPVRYLSSEMAAEELRTRLEAFDLPITEWSQVDFRSRRDNFADLIDPEGINIIDFLEKYDQFWSVGGDIRAVFDKLKGGICIIAIQKDKGAESGRGGMFTREKCRLHIALGDHKAKIDDVKIFKMPGYNPNGLVMKYKLIAGARFDLQETIFDAPGQNKR